MIAFVPRSSYSLGVDYKTSGYEIGMLQLFHYVNSKQPCSVFRVLNIPCAEQFSKSAQLFRSSEYNQEKTVQASEVIHRFIATALFRMVRS